MRSAYDLMPHRNPWWERSACRHVDPELFWPDADGDPGPALHVCQTHCPVLVECARDAQRNPPQYPQVVGGVRYTMVTGGNGRVHPGRRDYLPSAHGCRECQP